MQVDAQVELIKWCTCLCLVALAQYAYVNVGD